MLPFKGSRLLRRVCSNSVAKVGSHHAHARNKGKAAKKGTHTQPSASKPRFVQQCSGEKEEEGKEEGKEEGEGGGGGKKGILHTKSVDCHMGTEQQHE